MSACVAQVCPHDSEILMDTSRGVSRMYSCVVGMSFVLGVSNRDTAIFRSVSA